SNKKEDKIEICFNGKNICVDRAAAPTLIKKGAYLGECIQQVGNSINNSEANVKTGAQPVSINAYPNPFSNHITLTFKVTKSGLANLSIYDVNGRRVSTLFNKEAEK